MFLWLFDFFNLIYSTFFKFIWKFGLMSGLNKGLQPVHEKDMNNDVFPLNVIMGQTGWVQQGDLRSVRQNTGCVRVMAAVTQQNCHDWMIS